MTQQTSSRRRPATYSKAALRATANHCPFVQGPGEQALRAWQKTAPAGVAFGALSMVLGPRPVEEFNSATQSAEMGSQVGVDSVQGPMELRLTWTGHIADMSVKVVTWAASKLGTRAWGLARRGAPQGSSSDIADITDMVSAASDCNRKHVINVSDMAYKLPTKK